MNLLIEDIETSEILHYLGITQGEEDTALLHDIEQMKHRIIALSEPRLVYHCFPILKGQLLGVDLFLPGKDIQRLLKESHHCILLAATLGIRIETENKKLQRTDMGKAIIFDSCASAAIEQFCDVIQGHLEVEYGAQGMFLTERYSCGYGDFPLELQKPLLSILEAPKKIGLYANESNLLIPRKSITAIIGVANQIQPAIVRGCIQCLLKDTCIYRRDGVTCENKG